MGDESLIRSCAALRVKNVGFEERVGQMEISPCASRTPCEKKNFRITKQNRKTIELGLRGSPWCLLFLSRRNFLNGGIYATLRRANLFSAQNLMN
jgi:hypothetical protein